MLAAIGAAVRLMVPRWTDEALTRHWATLELRDALVLGAAAALTLICAAASVLIFSWLWNISAGITFRRLKWLPWPWGLLILSASSYRLFLRDPSVLLGNSAALLSLGVLGGLLRKFPLAPGIAVNWKSWLLAHRYALTAAITAGIGLAWIFGAFGPRRHPVGDEPSYLMIAHSISEDCDVVMDDDYDAKAYRAFYHGDYPEFTHVGYDGRNYPHHSIGLPILLAPFYALFRHHGPQTLIAGMRLVLLAIYVLLALATLKLTESYGLAPAIALWSVAAVFLSGPLLFFCAEIYPETLDALIMVLAVGFLGNRRKSGRGINWLLLGLGLAVIPWLGIKYIVSALALGGVAIWEAFSRGRRGLLRRSWLLAPVVISGAIYFIFLYSLYRNLNPGVIYTGVHPGTGTQILRPGTPTFWEHLPQRPGNMLYFIWGFLLEQRIGLLFFMPIALLLLPGSREMWRGDRWRAFVLLLPVCAHIYIYAWHDNWGGFCPPNRQAIPVLPLLTVPLAFGLASCRSPLTKLWAIMFCLIGWRFSYGLLHHERWLYTAMNPHLSGGGAQWLYQWSPLDGQTLPKMFPLLMGPIKYHLPNILWTLFFSCALIVVWRWNTIRVPAPLSPVRVMRVLGIMGMVILPAGLLTAAFVPSRTEAPVHLPGQWGQVFPADGSIIGTEGEGFWLRGECRGRMLIAAPLPVDRIRISAHSLVENWITARTPRGFKRISLPREHVVQLGIRIGPWFPWRGLWLAKIELPVQTGASPYVLTGSNDNRFLGAYVTITPE